MPHRLVSLGILLFWAVASSALLIRDILPEVMTGPAPDMRTVANAPDEPGPVLWNILMEERAKGEPGTGATGSFRSIGQVTTETKRQNDGHVQFLSHVWFESGTLLGGASVAEPSAGSDRLEIRSLLEVDGSGNLYQLRSGVRAEGDPAELLVIEGHLEHDQIVVKAHGPALRLSWRKAFPYKARGMVQNSLGPMDRLPGLHVGQRWETQVVSPLTGQVERVSAEVIRKGVLIHWGEELVPCHELVTRAQGLTARTWARARDGLVIRQEVPLLFVKLMLEREARSEGGEGTVGVGRP